MQEQFLFHRLYSVKTVKSKIRIISPDKGNHWKAKSLFLRPPTSEAVPDRSTLIHT